MSILSDQREKQQILQPNVLSEDEQRLLQSPFTIEGALLNALLRLEQAQNGHIHRLDESLRPINDDLQIAKTLFLKDYGPEAVVQNDYAKTDADRDAAIKSLRTITQRYTSAQQTFQSQERNAKKFAVLRRFAVAMFEETGGTTFPPSESIQMEEQPPIITITRASMQVREVQDLFQMLLNAAPAFDEQAPPLPFPAIEETPPPLITRPKKSVRPRLESTAFAQDVIFKNWTEILGDVKLARDKNYVQGFRNSINSVIKSEKFRGDFEPVQSTHDVHIAAIPYLTTLSVVELHDLFVGGIDKGSEKTLARILALVHRHTFSDKGFIPPDQFVGLAKIILMKQYDKSDTVGSLISDNLGYDTTKPSNSEPITLTGVVHPVVSMREPISLSIYQRSAEPDSPNDIKYVFKPVGSGGEIQLEFPKVGDINTSDASIRWLVIAAVDEMDIRLAEYFNKGKPYRYPSKGMVGDAIHDLAFRIKTQFKNKYSKWIKEFCGINYFHSDSSKPLWTEEATLMLIMIHHLRSHGGIRKEILNKVYGYIKYADLDSLRAQLQNLKSPHRH